VWLRVSTSSPRSRLCELLFSVQKLSGTLRWSIFRYQWEGKIQEDNELLLIMKTKSDHLELLKQHVIANHPYDVPEFISMPVIILLAILSLYCIELNNRLQYSDRVR